MAKTRDIRQDSGAADNASADLGRVAAGIFGNAPIMPIHPLMAHPAAAFAAVTAIGFGFSSQLAGAFLGAFQGAVEATTRLAEALEDEKHQDAVAAKPADANDGAGDAKPIKAAPVAKSVTSKPAALKAAAAAKQKPVAAKKAEPKPAVAAPKVATAAAKGKAEIAVPDAVKPAPARSRKVAEKTDDLKRISGIGPKLEQVLNGRGIKRFADIAAWSDADIERIDGELGFEGRIRRDDWVGQAKALLPKGRS